MVAMGVSLTTLGTYICSSSSSSDPAPLYRGSAAGQPYVARYALGCIVGVLEQLALRAQVPGGQAARTHTRAGIRAAWARRNLNGMTTGRRPLVPYWKVHSDEIHADYHYSSTRIHYA